MGKLTDSLKATTKRLDRVKHGIQQMQDLGRELTENTATVAESALRAGHAYAQAEMAAAGADTGFLTSLPSIPEVLDADQLDQAAYWTEKSLKQRFGNFRSAYRYLRDTYNISPKSQSWKAVIDAFNHAGNAASAEDRIAQLEKIITLQNQRIAALETKLDQVLRHLEQANL